jgi:S1-C subfamily serine protease
MRDDSNKFVAFLTIIATSFALGAFFLAWAPAQQYTNQDPTGDGYVPPRSIQQLVETTQESTVTVWCDVKGAKDSQGTAWAVELETTQSGEFPTTLITNHHVIEECIGVDSEITINLPFEDEVKAVLIKWDEENDLAVLATKKKLPVLKLSDNSPWPGYWVMALGSADGFEGSVSFGNVLNVYYNDILITNNISRGNSGGPLVDNEGAVVGIVTWGMEDEQYNGAKSMDAFCSKIFDCKYEFDGEKTWWDYSDD